MSEAFARHMRLTNASDFQQVFADPCKSADASLVVLARGNNKTYPRLGLAIARKHLRTAVARNRLKRVIRESFRKHHNLLEGLDVVVLARPGVVNHDPAMLRGALHRHWSKIKRKCEQDSRRGGQLKCP